MAEREGVLDAIADTLKGNFVTKDEMESRRKVCASCPNNQTGICTICNCVILWKTTLKGHECPEKHWT